MEFLAGRYLDKYGLDKYGSVHELSLFSDTTFVYLMVAGMMNDTVTGKWFVGGREIVLIPSKTETYHVIRTCDPCQDKDFIKVYDAHYGDDIGRPYVHIYGQGRSIKSGFIDSLDILAISFDSLKIDQLWYQPYWLIPKDKIGLAYDVYLKSERIQMREKKMKLKIKGKNLITESDLVLKRQR